MPARRVAAVLAMLLAGCASPAAEPPPDSEFVTVAEQVCTVLWDWQLDIGAIMNAMSAASKQETDGEVRQTLYRDSFSQARQRNEALATEIALLPGGPFIDPLREDIRNGLFAADQIIAELDTEVDTLHSTGPPGYHEIVPKIFMSFEKVIDVAKPEMADYANPDLTRAFVSVPQCQHGVKDANDGQPRFVPRS